MFLLEKKLLQGTFSMTEKRERREKGWGGIKTFKEKKGKKEIKF